MELNREVNRATRRDNKVLREAGVEGSILRGVLVGKENPNTPELEFGNVMRQWMCKMRQRFARNVIRRTIDSLDCMGNKIFGMKPYMEHILKVKMYDWEMGNLRDFAKEIVKENLMASPDARKVSAILCPGGQSGMHPPKEICKAWSSCPLLFLYPFSSPMPINILHSTFTSNSAVRSFTHASIRNLAIIGRSLPRWKPGTPRKKKQSNLTP